MYGRWRKRSSEGRVLMIFDEVDKWFPDRRIVEAGAGLREYARLFRTLRGLAQEHRCLSVLAVSYRRGINRQNLLGEEAGENPMFMSYQEYSLGFLPPGETAAMIRKIGWWKQIEWTDEALDALHMLTGGHPFLARLAARDACEQGTRKAIEAGHVTEAGDEIQRSFHRHRIGSYYRETILDFLRPDEQAALYHTIDGKESADAPAGLQDALTSLELLGLITQEEGNWRVQGALLEAWLRRNRPNE
jgi:hypothetical protein